MIQWAKEHPYLSGTFVLFLIVLFLIIRSRSSSSSASAASGPSGPSDALQVAGLQAQVQQQGVQAAADIQSQQTAAALAAHLADTQAQQDATTAARDVALQNILTQGETAQYGAAIQLAAVNSTNAAQVAIGQTQAQAGVQVAAIGANAAVKIAGIQGDVTKFGYETQLKGLIDTNATSVLLGGLDLQGLMDTNRTALGIVGTQEETKRLGITTAGTTQQLAITTAGDVSKLDIGTNFLLGTQHEADVYGPGGLISQNQTEYWNSIFADDRWGGGLNQVAALSAITNQPAIGTAAAGGQAQSNVASSNMWSGFWSGLFGTTKTLAAAA